MVEHDWEITRIISVVPGKCGSAPLLPHTDGEDLPHRAVPLLQKYFFWSNQKPLSVAGLLIQRDCSGLPGDQRQNEGERNQGVTVL